MHTFSLRHLMYVSVVICLFTRALSSFPSLDQKTLSQTPASSVSSCQAASLPLIIFPFPKDLIVETWSHSGLYLQ